MKTLWFLSVISIVFIFIFINPLFNIDKLLLI